MSPTRNSIVVVHGAVEGIVDEAVVRRLVCHVGGTPGTIYGKNGKTHLLQQLKGYNRAAAYGAWVVLVDLDQDEECAPPRRQALLPHPEHLMCFRIAVRAVEAWLLADRARMSAFLGVPASWIPLDPEMLKDPKEFLVGLARRSRRTAIRADMVPRPGSSRNTGPAYASRLIEFVEDEGRSWQPDVAAQASDSLERCLRCLGRLVRGS